MLQEEKPGESWVQLPVWGQLVGKNGQDSWRHATFAGNADAC